MGPWSWEEGEAVGPIALHFSLGRWSHGLRHVTLLCVPTFCGDKASGGYKKFPETGCL